MYQRAYLKILRRRLESSKFIQVIIGPRQCGKTTMVEQLIDSLKFPVHYVSADAISANNGIWISQQWETARLILEHRQAAEVYLIIDEIQKINNWSEFVKKEYDKDVRTKNKIRVILLGSSSLLIQQGLKESLTGRFELLTLPHWSFNELHDAFNLSPEQYVFFGAYPGAVDFISDENRWRDYLLHAIIETTVSKDILQLTTIHKPALLKNLFEFSCVYSAEIISYNKMLGQLQDAGNTTTLAHYQQLLHQAWMVKGLQKFSGSGVQEKGSSPKWVAYNNAFIGAIQKRSFKEVRSNPVIWGRRVEQAVGAHLLNSCRINNLDLYYWRERDAEVDFIVRKGSEYIAIEVKTSADSNHEGTARFLKQYHPSKTWLISEQGLNWKEFLKMDIDNLF